MEVYLHSPMLSWRGALLNAHMTWQSIVDSWHTESCGAWRSVWFLWI